MSELVKQGVGEGQNGIANMIKSIEEYTDREKLGAGEGGVKDLATLRQGNAQNLIKVFGSSLQEGLSSAQVQQNEQKYGNNEYKKRKRRSFCSILKQAVCNELIIILSIAAVVSIVVEYFAGEKRDLFWLDGVSIMCAVLICVLISTISNYQKQKKFDELDQMTEDTYNYDVLRDGKKVEVHRNKIVPGDIVFITNGMEIPADCLVYKAVNIVVNQSAITGESVQVFKDTLEHCLQQRMELKAPTPLMISGANVVSGEGLMMAVVVGKDSRAGKSFQLIFEKQMEDEDEKTALELQLERVASFLGRVGFFSGIFIFLVLVARLLIEQLPKGTFSFQKDLGKLIHYIIIGVTVIVVSIPEGLPLAVTITLAYSMRAMHKDKILVRKLASCEVMGAATYVCSDKTGTITQNKMNVMHVVNHKAVPIGQFKAARLHKNYFSKLVAAIFHNTSAHVETEKGPQTQIALLKMARNLTGHDEVVVRKNVGHDGYFKRLPFDSSRKRMTTGLKHQNEDILFMNGASEQILEACQFLQNYQTNEITKIDQRVRQQIHTQLQAMAGKGLRTVSVAYKVVDSKQVHQRSVKRTGSRDVVEEVQKSGFTLLGIFGIEDPPRPESREAIENCRKAGIKVIMVTGDNKITAENIATEVGITEDGKGKVVEATQLIKMLEQRGLLQEQVKVDKKGNKTVTKNKKVVFRNEQDQRFFQELIDNLVVMARSRPQHKYILVDGINKLGHIVGVTGDGANDAPALMRADIGIAMGETGTQVAKNASDIVILDDRFDSIVRAVVWGRNVYMAIRKFLQFQLTVNLIAVLVTLVSAAVIQQTVLATIQLLWINLIMDSVAVIALATEPPNTHKLLNQKPNNPDERLITNTMLKHIIGQSIFHLIIILVLLFFGPRFLPEYADSFDQVIGKDLEAKYFQGIAQGTMTDGKYYMSFQGGDGYRKWFQKYENYSRHFTFIFNTFVFLQIFNFICCRRIKDELNFFQNIFANKQFWIVILILTVLQVLVITFAGKFFQIYRYGGLTILQWLISIAIGTLTMPFSIFLRLLPFCKPEDYERKKGRKYNKKKKQYVDLHEEY